MSSNIHESRQEEFRRATLGMTVLAAVFVALRFLARWKKGLKLGVDDYGMLVSFFFLFAEAGLTWALIHYGMGLHAETVAAENFVMIFKILMAHEVFYNSTVALIKISILLLYIRIFPTRGFRITAFIIAGIAVTWAVASNCVSIFHCTPVAKAWDRTLPGSCIDRMGQIIGKAIPNILTDVVILFLPVRMVWKLHAPVAYRVGVIGIFMLGGFVVLCSIYRLTTIFEVRRNDITWSLGNPSTWSVIECASGIISGCLPTLYPLFMMIPSPFSNRRDSDSISDSPITEPENSQGKGIGANGYRYRNSVGGPTFRPRSEVLAKNDVRTETSLLDEADGDEAPLDKYSIRVQHDVTWQESIEDGSAHMQR